MKESYKLVNGKIVAYDNREGIVEYDYQDNIKEVLNQENVVEQISNDIEELKKVEEKINERKKSLIYALFGEDCFVYFVFCVTFSMLIPSIMSLFDSGMGIATMIGRILAGITLLSGISLGIHGYKKGNLKMEAKQENIKAQIKEFEEILEKEVEKLSTLKQNQNKTISEETFGHESKSIDNSKIEALSDISKKKYLYNFFRENLLKLEKLDNKEKLNEAYKIVFSDEDVKVMQDMVSDNKVLSKRRKNK